MEYESRDDAFPAILAELDKSKALVLKSRAEVDCLLTARSSNNRSSECFTIFETANRIMNEATARYRLAVESFNHACRNRTSRRTVIDAVEMHLADAHATANVTCTLAVDEPTGKVSNEYYKRLKELG